MGDRWIVSQHPYKMHTSLSTAETEAARLRAKVKEKTFRVYRVKTHLTQGNIAKILAVAADLVCKIKDPEGTWAAIVRDAEILDGELKVKELRETVES